MAWTSPMTAIANAILTAAQWNQYVRDNLNYLKGITDGATLSGVSVRRAAVQSVNTSTDTLVSFDTELHDYGGWWSSGTTATTPAGAIPTGFTTVAVLVIAATKWATNATGKREMTILKNGGELDYWKLSAIDDDATSIHLTTFDTTAAADTWQLQVWQNSGGALNMIEGRLTVLRIAPAA